MAYCGEHSAVNSGNGRHLAVSLRCRSWGCEECAQQRKAALIAQAIGGNPQLFLTLTMRRVERMSPDHAARRLSWAWRVTRLRLMRRYKLTKLPFLAVMEKTKAGWPHLHVLIRHKYLDQKFISECMAELCDGPNVWIERIDRHRKAAVYCAKYCAKASEKFLTAKRYWQTRDYDQREDGDPKKKPAPGMGWELWTWDLDRLARSWIELGWDVKWRGHHAVEAIVRGPPT